MGPGGYGLDSLWVGSVPFLGSRLSYKPNSDFLSSSHRKHRSIELEIRNFIVPTQHGKSINLTYYENTRNKNIKMKNVQGLSIGLRNKGREGGKGRDFERWGNSFKEVLFMWFLSCLLLSVPQFPHLQVRRICFPRRDAVRVICSCSCQHPRQAWPHNGSLFLSLSSSLPARIQNLIKNSPGLAHSISGRRWQAKQNGLFSLVSESVWLCFEVLGNEVAGYTCECHYVTYFGHCILEIFRALFLSRNLSVSCKNIHGQNSSLWAKETYTHQSSKLLSALGRGTEVTEASLLFLLMDRLPFDPCHLSLLDCTFPASLLPMDLASLSSFSSLSFESFVEPARALPKCKGQSGMLWASLPQASSSTRP